MAPKGSPPPPNTNPNPRDRGAPSVPGPSAVPKGAGTRATTGPAAAAKPATTKARGPIKFDPPADWDSFFKALADVSEAQLSLDIAALRGRKDFVAIEKALTAYLKYHNKHAAPWMYEQLATSMEINKRDPAAIKANFGWGAHLAQKSKDPIALIAAADLLLLHKYYEIDLPSGTGSTIRVKLAEVLDDAMAAAPHRPHPILMSLVLAEGLGDPKRMGDSAERLLSLGWPGMDETWRTEIPKRVRNLAKRLREEGRGGEAQALLQRLPAIEARDLVIRLTWTGEAALDLIVDEPLGATCDHFAPRTVFGGALIKEGRGRDKEAVYVCPRAFDGEYAARVNVLFNDEKKPAQTAKVEIVAHEGTDDEKVTTRTLSLSKLAPAKVTLAGGRRKMVLPYEAPNRIKTPEDLKGKGPEARPAKADGGEAKPKP